MKIFVPFAILFCLAQCHLTNRTRVPKVESLDDSVTKVELKRERVKDLSEGYKMVYLEDVIYGLRNQDWRGEEACLNKTMVLLQGLQNFTLWAVWNWDAVSSQPLGLLFGNQYQLGNFDECMNPPWAHTHPELRTQYCTVDITLERTDNVNSRKKEPFDPYQSALDYIQHHPRHMRPLYQLTWGICVPATCGPSSVEKLLDIMIARSHVGTAGLRPKFSDNKQCQLDTRVEVTGAMIGFSVMIVLLAVVTIACTFIRQNHIRKGKIPTNRIVKAFCLVENSVNLLEMKKEGTEVIYGIRFICTCFIVLGHQIGYFNSGAVSDGAKVDQDIFSTGALFFLHSDLFVDSFFVLSGFLLANALMRNTRVINPLLYIVRRYVRLIVAFALVIFYMVSWFAASGSGPLWPRAVAAEAGACHRTWWLGLLMLGNYVHTDDMCLLISWYIPVDFHYFVIAVCCFWCYQHCKKIGYSMLVVFAVASVTVPAVINYMYNLPAIQLFTFEFVSQPRVHQQFHLMYIKSHTRAAAYVIGFLSGCAFYKLRERNFRMSTTWATICSTTAFAVMLATLVTGPFLLWSTTPVEAALYAALNRPLWAAASAVLLLACCFSKLPRKVFYVLWLLNGDALYAALNRPLWAAASAVLLLACCFSRLPGLSSFLTWFPFVPLSRLAYGLYLTHTLILTRNVFSIRNPATNDFFVLFIQTFGVIVVGLFASFLIWLLAEAPINNLFTILLSPDKKYRTSEDSHLEIAATSPHTSLDTIASTSGHLKDNLPNTIQYSSKF